MQSRALLLRGRQGVGKSSVAEHMADNYNFCRLSKDDFYVPIMERFDDHRMASDVAYMGIRSVLKANSGSGIDFVVDAPFNGPLSAPALLEDLGAWGLAAKSILLVCTDLEEWESRLQSRRAAPSINHLVTSLDEVRAFRGSLDSVPLEGEPVLDTAAISSTMEFLAAQCVAYVRSDNGS